MRVMKKTFLHRKSAKHRKDAKKRFICNFNFAFLRILALLR